MGRSVLAACLLVVVAVAACSSSEEPAPDREPSAADARADATILPKDALPAGWTRVPARERLSGTPGTPRYCGVVAEPDPVEEGRIAWYEATDGVGGSVLEYAMVSTTEGATRVLDELVATGDDCREPGHDVSGVPEAELADLGDQAVAWDFTDTEDASIRFRTLVLRRDDTVVVLVATGPAAVPVEQQAEIARSIDERLTQG